jgi:hypothetical protein
MGLFADELESTGRNLRLDVKGTSNSPKNMAAMIFF